MSDLNEYREKWKHEDELINQRLTWLLFTQTILFAGYANILIEKNPNTQIQWLLLLMEIFGVLFCIVIGVSVSAAIFAMYDLKQQFKITKSKGLIDTSEKATKWGLLASISLPLLFLLLWITIFIFNLV